VRCAAGWLAGAGRTRANHRTLRAVTDIVAETAVHPLPNGEVRLLGAVSAVTGAMTLVELHSAGGASGAGGARRHRVLVDCGVAQGREARHWSLPDDAHRVDAIVLTHAHNDHVGSLPDVIERGYDGPIFGTRATLAIARIVLEDGLSLDRTPNRDRQRIMARFAALARPVPYGKAGAWIDGLDAQFAMHEAGHILGSASLELTTPQSRIVVSGDLGRPDSPILRDYNTTWSSAQPLDLVVMESTYGDHDHAQSHDDVAAELERIVNRAMTLRGHILVPAFAIGRTQTLLWHLNALIEAGRIRNLPVAIDTPMGLQVTETYDRFRDLFDREAVDRIAWGDDPLDFDGLYAVRRGKDSERLRDVEGPMLVIAGSGMCTGGRIMGHLRELLPLDRTTVLFVGFQAPGTTGRAIQQASRSTRTGEMGSVRIDGEYVDVRAHIETLSGLSAHADRGELARWLGALPTPRRVALHHGEPDAQHALVSWLRAH